MSPRRTRVSLIACMVCTVSALLLSLLWLLHPSTPTRAQSQPTALGSVSGTVRDDQGEPLANITVWLEQTTLYRPSRTVTSNSNGVYHFVAVPSGIYTLRFEDTSHTYATKYYADADFTDDANTITVNGDTVSDINMEMHKGGTLTVMLDDAVPITPTYYTVTLYRQAKIGGWLSYRQMLSTLGKNSLTFTALPSGAYRLCAVGSTHDPINGLTPNGGAECYANVLPETYSLLAPNASDIFVDSGTQISVAMTLNDVAQVKGYVLAPDDQPLANIPVLLYLDDPYGGNFQKSVLTDDQGYFNFPYVFSGKYGLIFNAASDTTNNYLPLYYPDETTPSTAQSFAINGTTRVSITRKLQRAATITGRLSLAGDGPLPLATITIERQWSDGTWHDYWNCYRYCAAPQYDTITGIFTATKLIPGNYRLGASYQLPTSLDYAFSYYRDDSLENATEIKLSGGEVITGINFAVGEDSYDAAITGQVTANGQPIQGISVGLFSPFDPYIAEMPLVITATDADGKYRIEGLVAGYYRLGFRDPNGVYATNFYGVDSGGYTAPLPGALLWISDTLTLENINMALSPGSTLRGRVHTQLPAPPGGMTVRVIQFFDPFTPWHTPIPWVKATSDANGNFEITGLLPGNYYLSAVPPAGSGEFPPSVPRYYPNSYDSFQALTISIGEAEVVEGKDIYFFSSPQYFLPSIRYQPNQQQEMHYLPLPDERPEPLDQ